MISKNNTQNSLPKGLKIFKNTKAFAEPLLICLAVVCGILSLFKSKEGSNSRLIVFLIFLVAIAMIAGLEIMNYLLNKKSDNYRTYNSRVVQKMAPSAFIPLFFMVLLVAVPFYIILVTSFKTFGEANDLTFTWFPKQGFSVEGYKELFELESIINLSMPRAIFNSLLYALIPTTVGVFVSAVAAYAFAKLKFKTKKTMYQLLIMTIMMPGCVTLSTSFIMFSEYGWVGTPLPILIPGLFGGAATVMFMREYFMGIPDGLLEAAKIDGANNVKQFFLVILPLGKPALIAQFILGFISRYNEYLMAKIYLDDAEITTIQIYLDFFNSSSSVDNTAIAAAGVISLVPMLTLYVIFQKKIINGISMSSGLKG